MDIPEPLITTTPERMNGTPVFAGTGIPIKILFDFLADGASLGEFLAAYPNVSRDHAVAVLNASKAALILSSMSTEPYRASADELAAIAEAEEQLARGERVPQATVDAFWRRHGL
jgi:uncharacterized protein (DUF433 family)